MIKTSNTRRILVFLLVTFIFALTGCSYFAQIGGYPEGGIVRPLNTPDGAVRVTFMDVGQGDCTLIELPEGEIMLIDSGTSDAAHTICKHLDYLGTDTIDYLVATHPHADHIGSMTHIINTYNIQNFYMPNHVSDTRTFINMLNALDENKVSCQYAKAGDVIFETDSVRCEVLSPVLDSYSNTNDASVVLRLSVGEKSFLFMGDAEQYAERLITTDVSADVLKVGHHGSSTSTSKSFLNRVSPSYAVISCGRDNSYGHPHDEILELLEEKDIQIYRTDLQGDITIVCDGQSISAQ